MLPSSQAPVSKCTGMDQMQDSRSRIAYGGSARKLSGRFSGLGSHTTTWDRLDISVKLYAPAFGGFKMLPLSDISNPDVTPQFLREQESEYFEAIGQHAQDARDASKNRSCGVGGRVCSRQLVRNTPLTPPVMPCTLQGRSHSSFLEFSI